VNTTGTVSGRITRYSFLLIYPLSHPSYLFFGTEVMLAQDTYGWRTLVNAAVNFRIP
jgi:hypothetical protein